MLPTRAGIDIIFEAFFAPIWLAIDKIYAQPSNPILIFQYIIFFRILKIILKEKQFQYWEAFSTQNIL